ncbi:MAG: pyridoxamine 5'-phosphate oxidase family protein [Candidatus Dormibacteria bacterium]
MPLSDRQAAFLAEQHSAAMITTGADGRPKVARVGVALVEGRLQSSGTQDRVRTTRLRRDPTCTLFVFTAGPSWLALETTVQILEGPDSAELNLKLFRVMQGRAQGPLSWFGGELDEAGFLAAMAAERRLIYEFQVSRAYGPA